MRLPTSIIVLVSLALAVAAVHQATRLADRKGGAAEVGRVKLTELSASMRQRLASLNGDLNITYYVSPASDMPSHMRRVERQVTDLLGAMKDAAGGRMDYHIVDPTQDPDNMRFAGRRKVAPVRIRHVAHDSYSEQEVWSTLTIDYGSRDPAMISAVGPDHLPRLQTLLVENINQLQSPRRPVFAVAAPAQGYAELRRFLAQNGEVMDCNFELNPRIPPDADVLFWIEPRAVDATLLRNIQHFVASGRHLVVAGSSFTPSVDGADLVLKDSGFDGQALLGAFGVRPVPGLVLDQKAAPMPLPTGEVDTPFRITCLAINQDFHSMAKEPRGTLLFVAPTAFSFDSERLAELGWQAEVLATTSDESTLLDEPAERLPIASLSGAGRSTPKQPLLIWLRNVDPWSGSVVACGAPNIFRDETFVIDTLAHKRLTDVLLATLAADDRLVAARASRDRPEPIPALAPGQRLLWRFIVILLPSLLLAIVAFRRLRRPAAAEKRSPLRGPVVAYAGRLLLGVVAIGLVASMLSGRLRADWTRGGLNDLAPYSVEMAEGASEPIEVELIASGPDRLPPEMRARVARLSALLDEYERHGAELRRSRVRPEDLTEAEREALHESGILPVKVTSRQDEVTTVRRIYSALRLRRGDRVEVLPFDDVDSFENAEFRVTFAVWRIATGRRPHIGFASDIPRLSSAENYQIYQSRGLIAPSGKDVYSLARGLLADCDFRVTHISPRDPKVPDDLDALVWIQPRRNVKAMLEAMVDYLVRGGNVILPSQHFVIQSRQYRGTEFKFNLWPQPQSPDVEEFYYPDLGVMMVREVLFDAVHCMTELVTLVYRSARREEIDMRHAKPFLIRAVPPNYDDESLITRNLGDLPMLVAAYFELDEERLAELGLTAKAVISTSPRSWSLDWKGGWLPDGYLPGPGEPILGDPRPEGEGDEAVDPADPVEWKPTEFLGSVPLAVLIEGQFPWPEKEFVHPPRIFGPDGQQQETEGPADYPHPEPDDKAPGRLLMIGCSEMFKDQRLTELRPEFRPDHLLLNAAAAFALEPALAEVITRRAVPQGFEPVPQEDRIWWRVIVLGAMPALLLLLLAGRALLARATVATR